jgi:hypothetical protein
MPAEPRHARAEAVVRMFDTAYTVRVLEPSPPADTSDPDYLADDPAVPGEVRAGATVVTPTTAGDVTWDQLARDDGDLAAWAADRWLGAWRRLPEVPARYAATRLTLHRLAVYVVSPPRMAAIGKMALRFTFQGFGTPFFGPDRQVRLDLADLEIVDERARATYSEALATLAAAARFVGVELDPGKADELDIPELGDPDAPLDLDPDAARFLADWFGFATSVLEQLRSETPAGDRPSRVQLWPEHFDPSFEAGDEDAGRRAGLGASPGDHHDDGDSEPYLYASVWDRGRLVDDQFWTTPFGSKLPFAELVGADDQREAALAFYRGVRDHLQAR